MPFENESQDLTLQRRSKLPWSLHVNPQPLRPAGGQSLKEGCDCVIHGSKRALPDAKMKAAAKATKENSSLPRTSRGSVRKGEPSKDALGLKAEISAYVPVMYSHNSSSKVSLAKTLWARTFKFEHMIQGGLVIDSHNACSKVFPPAGKSTI